MLLPWHLIEQHIFSPIPDAKNPNAVFKHLESLTEGLGIAAAVLAIISVAVSAFLEEKHKRLRKLNRIPIVLSAALQLYLAVKIVQFNHANDTIQTAQENAVTSADQQAIAADSRASQADMHAIAADKDAKRAHDDAASSLATFAALTDKKIGHVQGAVEKISSFQVVFSYKFGGNRDEELKYFPRGADDPVGIRDRWAGQFLPTLGCAKQRILLTHIKTERVNVGQHQEIRFTYEPLMPEQIDGKSISYLDACRGVGIRPSVLVVDKTYDRREFMKIKSITMEIFVNNINVVSDEHPFTEGEWKRIFKNEEPHLGWGFNRGRPFISDVFTRKE